MASHLNHNSQAVRNRLAVLFPRDGDGQVAAADDARHHDAVTLLPLGKAERVDHWGLCHTQ